MKNLTLSLLVLCFAISCTNPTAVKNTVNSNAPDTVGYYAARNLKGLGAFKIGETTYKQAQDILKAEIRKDYKMSSASDYKDKARYFTYQPKYLEIKFDKTGNIPISEYYREYFDLIIKEVKYDTTANFLKNDLLGEEVFGSPEKKTIKQFEYYIGDIEIMSLELNFFHDTLYNIRCNQEDKIEEGFKQKYGAGKYVENNARRSKNQITRIDEAYTWENPTVIALSQTYVTYQYKGNSDTFYNADSNSYFSVDTKNVKLKDRISESNKQASKARQRLETQNKQKDVNQL